MILIASSAPGLSGASVIILIVPRPILSNYAARLDPDRELPHLMGTVATLRQPGTLEMDSSQEPVVYQLGQDRDRPP